MIWGDTVCPSYLLSYCTKLSALWQVFTILSSDEMFRQRYCSDQIVPGGAGFGQGTAAGMGEALLGPGNASAGLTANKS